MEKLLRQPQEYHARISLDKEIVWRVRIGKI
jgi:hypothetical protein